MESHIWWKSYVWLGGKSFVSFETHPTLWGQKAKPNYSFLASIKRKLILKTSSMLMSRQDTVQEKTAKFDLVYQNRLVNMLVNRTMKWNDFQGRRPSSSFFFFTIFVKKQIHAQEAFMHKKLVESTGSSSYDVGRRSNHLQQIYWTLPTTSFQAMKYMIHRKWAKCPLWQFVWHI